MDARKSLKMLLFCAVFLLAPALVFPAEKAPPRGNKVLLSLRIAKARKEQRGIAFYKSIARQMKSRRASTTRPASSAR